MLTVDQLARIREVSSLGDTMDAERAYPAPDYGPTWRSVYMIYSVARRLEFVDDETDFDTFRYSITNEIAEQLTAVFEENPTTTPIGAGRSNYHASGD